MALFKIKNIILALLLLGFVCAAPRLQQNFSKIAAGQTKTENFFLANFDAALAPIFSLGNPTILRHFSMMYGLQYLQDTNFSDHKTETVAKTLSFLMYTGISIPGFYILACDKVIETEKNIALCEEFINIGMKYIPTNWLLPLYLAEKYNAIWHDTAKALPYFIIASEKPDTPEFMGSYINKLARKIELSPEELDVLKESIKAKILQENETGNRQ